MSLTPAHRPVDTGEQLPSLRLVEVPDAHRTLAKALSLVIALILMALVVTPWRQTAAGDGRVVALAATERPQVIEAPIEGRVLKWHVREGSVVDAGAPLFDIADNDPDILDRLKRERDALTTRLEAARRRAASIGLRGEALVGSRTEGLAAAAERFGMAKDRLAAARQAKTAAQASLVTAQKNLTRQRTLSADGLASRRALELAELDEARTGAELERADAAVQAAAREVEAFGRDRAKTGNDAAASIEDARASQAAALADAANADAEIARIDVRLARQGAQHVTAPRKGVIRRLLVAEGADLLKAGDPVAILVPDATERAVELWVDGNDAPLVMPGRQVSLQFEGWPALVLPGWPGASAGTFAGEVAVVDAADDGKGKFRVLVRPAAGNAWPGTPFLRQGTRAQGWVLMENVKLGYELWRVFNGFPPLVPDDVWADGAGGAKEKK
jgi:adhesin transport system membrane fusion protein